MMGQTQEKNKAAYGKHFLQCISQLKNKEERENKTQTSVKIDTWKDS